MPDDSRPLSSWPAAITRAVLNTWHGAAERGDALTDRLRLAERAYVEAGGDADSAEDAVRDLLAAGARERGDWLLGPDMRRIEAHRPYPGDEDYPGPGWPEPRPGEPR
ncbi:hypothetical protein ACE7GA_21310 [Roseomonas sp. CCTCC AB2023176]|uniref:hypothetical protein n=1 Tax=Roseomonas sp. CCTCC AB2023176 TaxID=3342640 RepID=UPI0035E20822